MNIKYSLLLLSTILLAFSSCDKEEKNNAPEYVNITYQVRADDQLVANAPFTTTPPREVTGEIKIYKNSFHHVLRFENFSIENGPDLEVYLSFSNENIDDNVRIGELKAASGNFNYTFSVNTDINAYKHVIVRSASQKSIYCVASF